MALPVVGRPLPAVLRRISDVLCVVWVANVCLLSFIGSAIGYIQAIRAEKGKRRGPCTVKPEDMSYGDHFLSVVIVVKDDAKVIGRTIRNLESTTANKQRTEIVLVDAGCKDNTLGVVRASAGAIKVQYVKGGFTMRDQGGRGAFLNTGQRHCRRNRDYSKDNGESKESDTDVILFLPADALTPPLYDDCCRRALADRTVAMAAFSLRLDSDQMSQRCPQLAVALVEFLYNMRTKFLQLPSGAQGLALRATDAAVQPFRDMVALEDLRFADEVRRRALVTGQVVKLLKSPILVHPCRWIGIGIFFSTLVHEMAHFALLYLHIPPENVYLWFYVYLTNTIALFVGGTSISPVL